MTVRYKTEGFIFNKEDRFDSDRLFSVFTLDFGKVELFAKAIRKINSKLRSGIDIFYLSEIEFIQGRNKKTLTGAERVEKFDNICEVPEKFEVATRIAEVVSHFIKGEEKEEKIFNLLRETLSTLNSSNLNSEKYNLFYHYFFWNFISILGHEPELMSCAICEKKLDPFKLYFSVKEGGIVCKNCYPKDKIAIEINSDAVKILRLILGKTPQLGNLNNLEILTKLKIENNIENSLKKVSESYCNYLLSSYSTL